MPQRIKFLVVSIIANVVVVFTATAQKQLQDSFFPDHQWSNSFTLVNQSPGYGITVDISNRCYVANGNGVFVYNSTGTLLTNWTVASARDIVFDPVSNIIVVCSATSNNQIKIYNSNFNLIVSWGTNSLNSPYGVAIGPDGLVYIADSGNNQIQVFDQQGHFQRKWGSAGSANGQFNGLYDIAVGLDGSVYATDYINTRIQQFDASGNYVASYSIGSVYWNTRAITLSPDGLVVSNSAQRSGTQWIDVNFSVFDSDNATVQVGAIGFVDGHQDLLSAVPMKSFTNGTDIVSWTNVTTGVQHHLTWDALTDWFALYGNLKVNILAKDNRNLLDFHLITIPSNATYATPLTISVSPYGHADFLGVWTWLIATRDPSVNLSTGNVYAVGNLYGVTNQTLLAQTQIASGQTNTLTTSDGRIFLYSMISSNMVSTTYSNMIVREATSNEIYRAAMGTTHTNLTAITKWSPLVQINGLPVNVNEYGFDTGSITAGGGLPNNAWWVVLVPKGP